MCSGTDYDIEEGGGGHCTAPHGHSRLADDSHGGPVAALGAAGLVKVVGSSTGGGGGTGGGGSTTGLAGHLSTEARARQALSAGMSWKVSAAQGSTAQHRIRDAPTELWHCQTACTGMSCT